MNIKQGELYWLDFGEPTESEPGYRRPCVVVQNDIFNDSHILTTVVCTITSNLTLSKSPGNILLKKGEGNLSKDSVVNVSQIVTVNKSDLTDYIGSLPTRKVNSILQGILTVIMPNPDEYWALTKR